MTYACPAWEFAADTHLLKLLPYMYDYITRLCRQHADAIQKNENDYARGIGKSEVRQRKFEA
jgi:hypothetical protein